MFSKALKNDYIQTKIPVHTYQFIQFHFFLLTLPQNEKVMQKCLWFRIALEARLLAQQDQITLSKYFSSQQGQDFRDAIAHPPSDRLLDSFQFQSTRIYWRDSRS